jgi:hypothetical protein
VAELAQSDEARKLYAKARTSVNDLAASAARPLRGR